MKKDLCPSNRKFWWSGVRDIELADLYYSRFTLLRKFLLGRVGHIQVNHLANQYEDRLKLFKQEMVAGWGRRLRLPWRAIQQLLCPFYETETRLNLCNWLNRDVKSIRYMEGSALKIANDYQFFTSSSHRSVRRMEWHTANHVWTRWRSDQRRC